ncbi:MAG: thioredoxin domain-containing protein [Candidatus Schekmanbacteria bacterium]|nr:thioredoxin domain-containing protein [Candidatus Schekmanbacteria bacterium]
MPASFRSALRGLVALIMLAAACANAQPADHQAPLLPGAAPRPVALEAKLRAALDARGSAYEPRTKHLLPDGKPLFTNRLILEDSPYLLQHAHNPVDWFAWGTEAFARARRENKPVFLSIGYSTCHWCHVMERESFEDIEVARLMNERFVCIKVDREQRPDVDEIYMTAVLLTTGSGGWPMSSFLTPEGKPFFGATYFPLEPFKALLLRIDELWKTRREQLEAQAEQIASAVERATSVRGEASKLGADVVRQGIGEIMAGYDAERGGFGEAPKFPHEPELFLLLQHLLRTGGDDAALAAVKKSATAMARGGIHDQVGGGFHRYSTDAVWLVPHFEKMLYNQAQLGRVYAHAHRLTAERMYARLARQTLDYVLRDMTSSEGGFYSATDADSEGREGQFFVWTPAEVRAALDPAEAELAIELFGVSDRGNFEGRSILHLPVPLDERATKLRIGLDDLLKRTDRIREKLYAAREHRVHPLRDEKILTGWNAMMITTLAEASEILGEKHYLEAAVGAAELLWSRSRRGSGELWRVHLDGASSIPAGQEDYAYLAEAFLALYDVTADTPWLGRARAVADGMLAGFWDEQHGGFFMSASGIDSNLIARPKSPSDGAMPSGNSVAVRALAMLAARSGEVAYRARAEATLSGFASAVQQHPAGYPYMLIGADEPQRGGAVRAERGLPFASTSSAAGTSTRTSRVRWRSSRPCSRRRRKMVRGSSNAWSTPRRRRFVSGSRKIRSWSTKARSSSGRS